MIEIPYFASTEHCNRVIRAYERCQAANTSRIGDGFFDHRVLWINSLPDSENEARRILQSWRHRATAFISERLGCRIYSDTIQVVQWTGQEMPPHQDDRHPDGRPHTTPWREWAGIIYLNSDFDGGEIYFSETDGERITYKPVTGSILFFEGARWHGVRAVTRGIRYTAPIWFTQDGSREDVNARIQY
jgi:predicted 2-oxoglutarate/Fe(II)-dependent dioxygenase YbiX